MSSYKLVKKVLDQIVGWDEFGAHGAFWRTLSRDQFISYKVFGYQLVEVGNGKSSNLVKSLKGESPFGSNIGTEGAFFRRMPAGRTAATASQINIISNWIDAGCPEHDEADKLALEDINFVDTKFHNAYWREFDNWAMFKASEETSNAIGIFFPVASKWFEFSKGIIDESEWYNLIKSPKVLLAINYLSRKQKETVEKYYNSPINQELLFQSYQLFGKGELPPDPLRPQDPEHKMNGKEMWFFWSAFADACLRLDIELLFWQIETRAVLIGLLHDGLFRGRFNVEGYSPTDAGAESIIKDISSIHDDLLIEVLLEKMIQSGI
ncbi:MAG: hypothetical protein GY839_03040 [candidate division Zixibacteria bacterium]|nr:hypothetical protein [candidate division Zixibacteria bacterium]